MRRGRSPNSHSSRRTQQRRPSPLAPMSSHSSRDRRGRRSTSIKSRSPKRDSGRIRGPISIEKKRSPSPRHRSDRRQRRSVSSSRRPSNKPPNKQQQHHHHNRTEQRSDFSPNGADETSNNNNSNRAQQIDISRSREAIKRSSYRSRSRSPMHATKSKLLDDVSSVSRSPQVHGQPSESQKSRKINKETHPRRSSSDTRYMDEPLSNERSFVFSASSKTEQPDYVGTKDIDERMQRQDSQPFKKEGDEGRFNNYDEDERRIRDNDRNKLPEEYGRDQDEICNERPSGSGKIYTQEELKKITVDIFRPVQSSDGSTKKRLSFNPNDVVIVRRTSEGQRPIFDRDEIKQALAGRGDNDVQERRVVAIAKERSRSPHREPETDYSAVEQRENFQINTENFQSYSDRDQNLGSTRPSLNDRWQKLEPRQPEWNVGASRSSRTKEMEATSGYTSDLNNDYDRRSRSRPRSRSRTPQHDPPIRYSYDRYFEGLQRSSDYEQRASVDDSNRNYSDVYSHDTAALSQIPHHRRPIPSDPHDLRHSLSYKRRESFEMHHPPPPSHHPPPPHLTRGRMIEREQRHDRHRHSHDAAGHDRDRGARRSRSWERIERRAPDTTTGGTRSHGHYQDERSQVYGSRDRFHDYGLGGEAKESSYGPPGRSGGGGRGLPNFSSRPDKYRYQEWLEKPDVVPKGPSYFEHDNRGDRHFNRSRGGRGGFIPPQTRGGYVPRPRGVSGFRGATSTGRGFRGSGHQPQQHYSQQISSSSSSSYSSRTKFSPSQWKHDMFERGIKDEQMDQDNNPSSTTGNK